MPRHTARAVIVRGNELLLIERWRDDLHYYSIPGGGIELNETAEQAVLREVAEETGCHVLLERQLYLLQLADGTEHHIFLCTYQSGEPHLPANSPEALENNPHNRFQPCWLPLSELNAAPFLVWQPIKDRLLHDIAQGFAEAVVTLRPNVVP